MLNWFALLIPDTSMTNKIFEESEVEHFVSSLFSSENKVGDPQFWMMRGARLATALILTVCNSKDADTSTPDVLSFKFLSDTLCSGLGQYRSTDLSRLATETRRIFYWADEVHAGTASDIHASQAEYVLQLYRNALPQTAIIAHLVRAHTI